MIPKLLVHPDPEVRAVEITKILKDHGFSASHPDLLWLEEEKLGVELAKQIRAHLALKPFQSESKAVVIIHADKLTTDAQNALLKTLEEPTGETIILLGISSEDSLLPTISSRSELVFLKSDKTIDLNPKYLKDLEQLKDWSLEKRFQYIEKLDDRLGFYQALLHYYSKDKTAEVLKTLLQAEKWVKNGVTLRAVLEYLLLIL